MAPLDDRLRMKAAIERSAPGAHRSNQQREMSDPPPSIGTAIEPVGKAAGHLKAIGAVVAAVIVAGVAAGLWLQTRPSQADLAAAESRAIGIAEAKNAQILELTKDVVRLTTTVTDMKTEQDRRWNNLDTVLQREFGSNTNNPAPPSFGPRARHQGRAQ